NVTEPNPVTRRQQALEAADADLLTFDPAISPPGTSLARQNPVWPDRMGTAANFELRCSRRTPFIVTMLDVLVLPQNSTHQQNH
ncbi:MAG: hypothetical protein VXZ49_01335, partial [Planctomycetota bacterium]|nr:hypothetical protein [Planctomycetota bacterium]